MKRMIAAALAVAALSASPAFANSITDLKSFVSQTHSMEAQFSQAVYDRNQRQVQAASGTMQFVRPGKFRWVYSKPYAQVLVGDGQKLWVYDQDLNQVTVKRLNAALGSSPAALLAGRNEIEQNFILRDEGQRNGLSWLSATPKSTQTSFRSIQIGFQGGNLAAMQLTDQLGQTTVLRFSQLKRNVPIAASEFHFTPPKGADVIGG